MTAFFVPGVSSGTDADRAYEDLRSHAAAISGRPPRDRRIYKLSCRRGGTDCETVVGEVDPASATTVHAIFDVGDRYAVYVQGGQQTVTKRQTYAVVEFDA